MTTIDFIFIWYIMGILSYITGVKIHEGKVTIEDILVSLILGIAGVILFVALVYKLLSRTELKKWYNKIKNKKVF